jgi:hypothetical protein
MRRPETCTFAQAHNCALSSAFAMESVRQSELVIKTARDIAPTTPEELLDDPTPRQTLLYQLARLAVEQLQDMREQLSGACAYCPLSQLADVVIPDILDGTNT